MPTLYTSLTKAENAAATDFSSMRLALSAAEVLSSDVFNGWKTLSWVDANIWRHVAPKGWFYNVMVTGVKPS